MKFKFGWILFPLTFAAFSAHAESPKSTGAVLNFSTEVSRTVEKDIIVVSLFNHKTGKNLSELKQQISANLNKVIDAAPKEQGIEFENTFSQYANYDSKGKITGWSASGYLYLESKNTEAVAKILDNLGSEVGIEYISFKVSPEKLRALEDEMMLEIIQQFQHKAELIKKGLNASKYTLVNVNLSNPLVQHRDYGHRMYEAASKKSADVSIPLEAGKQTISATASGNVVFE